MTGRFKGKSVVITGGASGIGESHVRMFAAEGARVFFGDISDGRALASEMGEQVRFHPLDVATEASWMAFAAAAEDAQGAADVLVSNAGVLPGAMSILDMDYAEWQRTLDVNLGGSLLSIKHIAPQMVRSDGGSIVVTSSVLGLIGSPLLSPYVASKWALRGLAQTAALELARSGIRVNSVHPGYVRTPLNTHLSEEGARDFPIPRFADPAEVSALVLFLASSEASYITGGEFVVDGGGSSGTIEPLEAR